MMRKVIKYLSIAKINSQARTVHPANVIARNGAILFRIWMFAQLYIAGYAALGVSAINGLTLAMTIWSIMFVQCFRSATRPRVSETIDQAIKDGSLAYSLNKPYSFILFHYFSFLGRVLPGMVLNLFMGVAVAYLLIGGIPFCVNGFIAGCFMLFFGYSLDFLINFLIGLSAFWIEDATAADWIYQRIQYVFGGLIVPISIFPAKVAVVAEYLPFTYLYYGAARSMVKFDPSLIFKYFMLQGGWIILIGFLTIVLFKRGIKYVSLNGG